MCVLWGRSENSYVLLFCIVLLVNGKQSESVTYLFDVRDFLLIEKEWDDVSMSYVDAINSLNFV